MSLNIEHHRHLLIFKALCKYGGTTKAAKELGMTARNLQYIIKKNPILWDTARYTYMKLNTQQRKESL